MVSRVVIPVLNLEQNDDPVSKVVLKGAKQLTTQTVVATSFSDDGATFSFQPPSQNTILDRRLDVMIPLQVTIQNPPDPSCRFNPGLYTNSDSKNIGFKTTSQGIPVAGDYTTTAPTQAQVNSSTTAKCGNNFAPRQMPLANIISNIDLTINGTHFTTDINTYYKTLLQYTTPEYRETHLSNCFHHPDTFAGTADGGYDDVFQMDEKGNAVVNPLALEQENGRHGETPRGAFFNAINELPSGTAGSVECLDNSGAVAKTGIATMNFYFVEPLLISPLMMSFGKGMTNINNVEITLRYRTDLKMAFSLFTDGNVVATTANQALNTARFKVNTKPNTAPQLFVRNYTAQDDIRIPNEIVLPYYQPKRFLTEIAASSNTGNAKQVNVVANNRRLDQIPESLYLTVKKQYAQDTMDRTDWNGNITQVKIQFGNQVGILSGHTANQLREIAVENGCDLDGALQASVRGYALKLDFGKDIPLQNNESPGTRGDYNIQVEITYDNPSGQAVAASLEELYVNVGTAVIAPNECRVQTGLLDLQDNVEAEDMGHEYSSGAMDLLGGGLFSSLKGMVKRIPHLVKTGAHHVKRLLPHIQRAVDIASKGADVASNVADLAQRHMGDDNKSGGTIVGGSLSGGSHGRRPYSSRRH